MEEEKIKKDSNFESDEKTENKNYNEAKKDFRIEIALILIVGILLGVMIKAESLKRVAVGFSDYKTRAEMHGYNIDRIEKELFEKIKEEQAQAIEATENAKKEENNSETCDTESEDCK